MVSTILLTQYIVVFVDNKRKAEVVDLDDGDSTSDEECNIPNP